MISKDFFPPFTNNFFITEAVFIWDIRNEQDRSWIELEQQHFNDKQHWEKQTVEITVLSVDNTAHAISFYDIQTVKEFLNETKYCTTKKFI